MLFFGMGSWLNSCRACPAYSEEMLLQRILFLENIWLNISQAEWAQSHRMSLYFWELLFRDTGKFCPIAIVFTTFTVNKKIESKYCCDQSSSLTFYKVTQANQSWLLTTGHKAYIFPMLLKKYQKLSGAGMQSLELP